MEEKKTKEREEKEEEKRKKERKAETEEEEEQMKEDFLEINKDKTIIKKAIEAIIKIINKWKSKNGIKGKFKISGIYEFGIWVIEDVEINIVFNDQLISKYFGSEKSICEPLISKNCKDNSLYCFLCREQFKDFEVGYIKFIHFIKKFKSPFRMAPITSLIIFNYWANYCEAERLSSTPRFFRT
uniref:Uncharacterized protein n=1 Tax=Meloidogyne enterolobii TaxID=390850 RepID=A0A6V7VF14_MELEN|nr:unnamed protein product [Meloidogyne enterolobii]